MPCGLTSAYWCIQQLASHGLFNVMVEAEGDTWIDDHHTNEDIGMYIPLQSMHELLCICQVSPTLFF